MTIPNLCPNCFSKKVTTFYEARDVPVNSMIVLRSEEDALNFPKGDIVLGFCETCGFVYNMAFNPDLIEVSTRYEATQGFSTTFNAFHRKLAKRLIDRYDLHNKNIIEIGCGQGEFLYLLCEIGNNRGVGFDPVYNHERSGLESNPSLKFISDFYSENYSNFRSDFVCCKMTLEHIQETAEFISMIRKTLEKQEYTVVFFQVPNAEKIWDDLAFWDIYYEHSSYFSSGSLSRLFQTQGFDIIDLTKEYDDQYLLITAIPGSGVSTELEKQKDITEQKKKITLFAKNQKHKMDAWRKRIVDLNQADKRIVIWGAGSKGVAFLTMLNITNEIRYAVDINPNRQNTFVAGTGQKIVSPDFLREYQPEYVIIMNPIYEVEIKEKLVNHGVGAKCFVME